MGATSSKHPSNRDGLNTSLSRSFSVPTNSVKVEAETFSKSSWRSRPFSMRKSSFTGNDLSSISVKSGNQLGDSPPMKPFSTKHFSKLKPVIEEEPCLDYEDRGEPVTVRKSKDVLQHDFRVRQAPSVDASEPSKRRLLGRSVSFRSAQEGQADGRSTIWSKWFSRDECRRETPSFLASTCQPIYSRSTSCNLLSMDRSTGLRFLLSPVATPSQSSASASKSATLNKSLSLNMRGGGDTFSDFRTTSGMCSSPSMRENSATRADWRTTSSSSVEPSSPLFDPSILASFEKAVEALSDDSWQSSDVSTRSSGITPSSFDNLSDAESPELLREIGANQDILDFRYTVSIREQGTCREVGSADLLRANDSYSKKLSFPKASSLDYRDWDGSVSLESFDIKCPPSGEGKIVLYFTSLRGIRRTFEDCCNLRLILGGFRMHVDERDIWMHSKFRQELTELMGVALSVPRLFVKGRYIGGAEEVKQLHEAGILGKLFEGLPTEWRNGCDVCGGVRFIPCNTCGGSCKIITQDDEKLRCPDCNENGLIMCPSCYW